MAFPWRGAISLLGAFLIQLILGTVYTDGNMGPYIISYLHKRVDPSILLSSTIFIATMHPMCQSAILIPSSYLEMNFGPKIGGFISAILLSGGLVLTYYTINMSFELVLVTYGIMYGFAISVGYAATITNGIRWFPKNRGIASGIVLAGFGLGASIFNPIQSWIINPNNDTPNKNGFFEDDSLLDRVPKTFLYLGIIYFSSQVIGCILIGRPSQVDDKTTSVEEVQFTPLQILRCKEFYILWATMFCNGASFGFFNAMYKAYGQTFIQDDQYLAFMGSITSVCNCLGRIIWGLLMDRFNYCVCMRSVATMMAFLLFSMPITFIGGKVVYTIWCGGLYFALSGTYALAPTVCSDIFGRKHMTANYALIFSYNVPCGAMTALMTSLFINRIHYNGMFFILGGLCVCSLLLTFAFEAVRNKKTTNLNINNSEKVNKVP